ncbi:MAG TPA: CHAD domain-containing protein, partial [Spirochaetota bacterium]|nr:CHAD domain-containing protein [Spirochaetota bacterium]
METPIPAPGPAMHPVIRDSLDERYAKFCAELANCRHTPSLDAVHDLRVSIRRLNAVLVKIEQFTPTVMVNQCARELKLLMKPLGKLRDVHVQVEWIVKTFPKIGPGLNEYLKKLWSKERRLTKKITAMLADYSPSECAALHRDVMLLTVADDEGKFPAAGRELLDRLFADLDAMKGGASARDNAAHLHAMRIALKKYRYTVEILKPALGEGAGKLLKRMHALQTLLGDIHDFDVLIAKTLKFSREKERTVYETANMKNALRKLRRQRREMNTRLQG